MRDMTITCGVCGLKIAQRATGWEHTNTERGRTADLDHRATPVKALSNAGPNND